MNNLNVAVLVNSCDSFEDCWPVFFSLFDKYGSGFKKRSIYLNSETKCFKYKNMNIVTINSNSSNWGKRVLNCLNQINTKYVFEMLDDFFLREEIDFDRIIKCIDYMENNKNIAVFYFDPIGKKEYLSDKYEDFCLLPPFTPWRCNTQAALWRKDILKQSILEIESPWEWEQYGTLRNNYILKKYEFYAQLNHTKSPINYGLSKTRDFGIVQGKWLKSDIEPLFIKHNINIDLSIRGFTEEKTYIDHTGEPLEKKGFLRKLSSILLNPFRLLIQDYKLSKSTNEKDILYKSLVIKPIRRKRFHQDWQAFDYKDE